MLHLIHMLPDASPFFHYSIFLLQITHLQEPCSSQLSHHITLQDRTACLVQGMLQWHKDAAEEAQRRREAAALERISALKSSDMTVRNAG